MSENKGILSTPSGEGASIEVSNNEIIVNKNIKVYGGGYLGFNENYPNQVVLTADSFDDGSSCISINNQLHSNLSKGQLSLFARNIDDDLACSIKMFYDGRIRYAYGTTSKAHMESYLVGIVSEYIDDYKWYRKWSNGLLEQSYITPIELKAENITSLTTNGQVYFGIKSWTFDIPYVDRPLVQVSIKDSISSTVVGVSIGDTISNTNINIYAYGGKTGICDIHCYSIGRWI